MRKDALKDLERSGITKEQAKAAGFFSIGDASELYPEMHAVPALVLPYHDPWTDETMVFERDGEEWEFARVRYLEEPEAKQGFVKIKPQRYGQPKNSGVFPFFPICEGIDWTEIAEDTDIPICITEGEKKALAGCLAGIPTIGLGGVYNFLSDGEMLAALARFSWKQRPTYICYDSDAANNPNIQAAEGRLATELSMKRNATVFLTRLPDKRNGDKQGIDDLIAEQGEDAFVEALENSGRIRKIDAEVLRLNESIAWIEKEGLVYDITARHFLQKSDLLKGSSYSSRKVEVPAQKGGGTKKISVADEWLTHPHAQRYADFVFDPSTTEPTVTLPNGQLALNSYWPLEGKPGNVKPFLDLNAHLTQDLPTELQDFPLKLVAYKFQNPHKKIPLAIFWTGIQGSGKSLWSKAVMLAAGEYGRDIKSGQLVSDFNGWIERALIGRVDELRKQDVERGLGVLKNLISEDSMSMNEKFRVARQVKTYTMYILTSNELAAASFSKDDRRMFIAEARNFRDEDFYRYVGDWVDNGGPEHLCHYLQTYDLQGWEPPARAPMTLEKANAHAEGLSELQQLAESFADADEDVIRGWLDAAWQWMEVQELSNIPSVARYANEVRTSLGAIPIRPFYTPAELAAMFPDISATLMGNRKVTNTPAGEISRQLREAGAAFYLRPKDDLRGFRYRGRMQQFLVIADHDEWKEPLSQNEFNRIMRACPRYLDTRR